VAEGVPWKTLAVLLDMEERTIQQYAQEGVFVKVARNQYLLAPSVRNYVRHLREVAAAGRYAVDEIEPSIAEWPALRDLIKRGASTAATRSS
jgi:phage terminase Nu1 subunit (DNA packaging protein)